MQEEPCHHEIRSFTREQVELFYPGSGNAIEAEFYQCLPLRFRLHTVGNCHDTDAVGSPAQPLQKFLIIPVLVDTVDEAGVYLDVIEAEAGKFRQFSEVMTKVFNADTAAEFLEGVAEVTKGFEFSKSPILRHFDPEPLAQVWVLAQQFCKFIPKIPVCDRFNG